MATFTDFESKTLGSSDISPFQTISPSVTTQIVADSVHGGTKCVQLTLAGLGTTYPLGGPAGGYCEGYLKVSPGTGLAGTFFTFQRGITSAGQQPFVWGTAGFFADGTMFVQIPSRTLVTSNTPGFRLGEWTHFSLTFSVGTATIDGIEYVTASVGFGTDRDSVSDGGSTGITFNAVKVFYPTLTVIDFTQWKITSLGLGSIRLDEIFYTDSGEAPPIDVAGRHIRAGQGITEVITIPTDSNIFASHGVIEVSELPDDTKIFITHGVIELLTLRIPTPGTNWRVEES